MSNWQAKEDDECVAPDFYSTPPKHHQLMLGAGCLPSSMPSPTLLENANSDGR